MKFSMKFSMKFMNRIFLTLILSLSVCQPSFTMKRLSDGQDDRDSKRLKTSKNKSTNEQEEQHAEKSSQQEPEQIVDHGALRDEFFEDVSDAKDSEQAEEENQIVKLHASNDHIPADIQEQSKRQKPASQLRVQIVCQDQNLANILSTSFNLNDVMILIFSFCNPEGNTDPDNFIKCLNKLRMVCKRWDKLLFEFNKPIHALAQFITTTDKKSGIDDLSVLGCKVLFGSNLGLDFNLIDKDQLPSLNHDYFLNYDKTKICLWHAAQNGKYRFAQGLIERGADVTFLAYERTPLIAWATRFGTAAIVRLLLRSGASTDLSLTHPGKTVLHLACQLGHNDIVKVLIEEGEDIETRTSEYKQNFEYDHNETCTDLHCATPLHFAAKRLMQESAQLLLEYGADINAQNEQKNTPLHLVVQDCVHMYNNLPEKRYWASELKFIEFLLKNNARVDLVNNNRKSVLDLAQGNLDLDFNTMNDGRPYHECKEVIKILEDYIEKQKETSDTHEEKDQ